MTNDSDTGDTVQLLNGVCILTRSFHDKELHRFHGHEHKCSRSTPISSMHNFSFASPSKKCFEFENFYLGEIPEEYDP